MNYTEYLLTCLAEECAEIGLAASKALRFGLKDAHPKNDNVPNDERIAMELDDLMGVHALLIERGLLRETNEHNAEQKAIKVRRFMKYSKERGTLQMDETDEEWPGAAWP